MVELARWLFLYNARMRLVLSHRTALETCSRIAASGEKVARACRVRSLRECASAARDVAAFDLSGLQVDPESKIDILVPNAGRRFASKNYARHAWTGPLPDGSLYQVSDGVYITSPEFSLLLLSKSLPFDALVLLCDEVCGGYALDATERGFYDRPALSSVSKVGAFLGKVGSASGTSKLRRALRYAVDNARSPMEASLAAFMAFPARCGGCGFPKPLMNHRFVLPEEAVRMAGRAYVEFDLFFPEAGVVVEYDSTRFHAADERLESDSRRNNVLRWLGFKVVNITRNQVRDPVVFAGVTAQLAKALGKTGGVSQATLDKRKELRSSLFPFGD